MCELYGVTILTPSSSAEEEQPGRWTRAIWKVSGKFTTYLHAAQNLLSYGLDGYEACLLKNC